MENNSFKNEVLLNGKISELLISLGGRIDMAGFIYAKEAIKYILAHRCKKGKLIKVVYQNIADNHNTSAGNVDKGLSHFFRCICDNTRENEINRVIGLPIYNKYDYLSAGQFLAILVEKLSADFLYYNDEWYLVSELD